MVLEASEDLKQLWEGFRHLKRILTLFIRFSVEFEVSDTFKMVLEASDNLKPLCKSLRHL